MFYQHNATSGLFHEVINLHTLPVRLVAANKVEMERMRLINIVGGAVIKNHTQADVVRVINDIARRHRRSAEPDVLYAGDLAEQVSCVGDGLIAGGGGSVFLEPEIYVMNEHGRSIAFNPTSGTGAMRPAKLQRLATS